MFKMYHDAAGGLKTVCFVGWSTSCGSKECCLGVFGAIFLRSPSYINVKG